MQIYKKQRTKYT